MQTRQQTTFSFDVRSVTLLAALTLGSATALMAQTGAPHAKAAAPSTDVTVGGPTITTAPTPSTFSNPTTTTAVFDRLDKDKNGQLSAVEARQLPAISERFKEADSDGNGQLSRAEFEKAVQL